MEFFNTYISKKAIKNALDVLRSGWISEGRLVGQFEEELVKSLLLKNPVALNSGTSALHLALVVAGIKPGDEVIIPAQTFVATGLAVLMQGATPVFADIQLETGNICPDSIERKINKKTKAIIPVHWAGYPCDMDEISRIAQRHKISVIEDAAHALGAVYKNKPIGTISRFTAFSFQAIKHLTTGDGGALCCLNKKDYLQAMTRRWFGINRKKSKISLLGERKYNIKNLGFKYHLNDLSAAIGLGNLENFRQNLGYRQKLSKLYRDGLGNIPGLKLLEAKKDRASACWIFTMLVEKRRDFIVALRRRGIPASVVHQRIDRNRIFGGLTRGLKNQERFDSLQVSLPIHNAIKIEDLNLIIKTIKKGW